MLAGAAVGRSGCNEGSPGLASLYLHSGLVTAYTYSTTTTAFFGTRSATWPWREQTDLKQGVAGTAVKQSTQLYVGNNGYAGEGVRGGVADGLPPRRRQRHRRSHKDLN